MRTDEIRSSRGAVAQPVRQWVAPALIVLIAFATLWPALLNGGPFFMADTPSYVRAAASGFYKVLGVNTDWADEYLRVYASAPPAAGASAAGAEAGQIPVTLSGRSIFYGALVFLAHLAGSLWLVVAIQSLLAGASIYLTATALGRAAGVPLRPMHVASIGLVTAAATPLGYFTGYLMPDLFGGFALLATANLLFLWSWQSRGEKNFWFLLLAYSLLVHGVNLMMVAGLTVLAIPYARWRNIPVGRNQLLGIGACLIAAVAGQWAFGQAVKSMTGAPPVRPPFVAMRLIADGPGYAYLEEHCPTEQSIYCRVVGRGPTNSDILLWSKDPKVSLFRGLSPDEQRRSSAEQSRFVTAVFVERPLQVAATMAGNSVRQLLNLDLSPFNYSSGTRARFHDTVPQELVARMQSTRAYLNVMPTRPVSVATALVSLLSIVLLIGFLAADRDVERRSLRAYCLGILAGLFVNAAICGALSGPKGRYETRLIWVLPVVALALGSTVLYRRRMGLSERVVPAA